MYTDAYMNTQENPQEIPLAIAMPWQKRAFDLVVTSLIVIVASPIYLGIVVAMLIEQLFCKRARGPLMYGEIRISQGKEFQFWKFRTFTVDALNEIIKKHGFVHTKLLEHKETQTYIGRLLTLFYLDELPQLYNVLKGDLSLVGPRPINLEVYLSFQMQNIYSKDIIKAGITGYYQCNKRQHVRTDVDMDTEYISYYSKPVWELLVFDVKIIYWTIRFMLKGEGL